VHSADCRVVQKHVWEWLEGSLKLNGSVWVKTIKRDEFQLIAACR